MFVLSQVFVAFAGVAFASTYFLKSKNNILILSVINNIFFGTHYLLLKQFTAAYTVYATILFIVVIYLLEKYNKAKYNLFTAILFSLLSIFITIKTWQGLISLIPFIAIVLSYLACVFKNVYLIKLFNLFSCMATTINLILIKSYLAIAQNLIILILGIIGIILTFKDSKHKKTQD